MQQSMSIQQMYEIRNNIQSFGLESYQIPKEYLDPSATIQNRELLESIKKGQVKARDKNRIHKSVFDVIMSHSNRTPAPNAYQTSLKFGVPKPEGVKPIIFKNNKNLPKKRTFLDQVQKSIVPGPAKYMIEKSEFALPPTKDQMIAQKNRRYASRNGIFCDIEHIGWKQPASNHYMIKSTIIPNNRQGTMEHDKKYYIEMEQKQEQLQKNKTKLPSPSHYHPIPQVDCFEKSFKNLDIKGELKDKSLQPHTDFGKNERFKHYNKGKESRVKTLPSPGPGSYNLQFEWQGKKDPKKQENKLRTYDKVITTGIPKSVYH